MAILLIHTGGTIGMVAAKDGFAPMAGVVEEFVESLVGEPGIPERVDIIALKPLIDSANATPADWNRIAGVIYENHDRYDGFVVTHGTDTMAYSAGALCFALAGLSKPVVLTGAMLPLTVRGNDGERNLIDALIAATTAPAGVWVQFAGRLLHGARVRKSHSRAFDAFAADPSDIPPRHVAAEFRLHEAGAHSIAVLAVAPGVAGKVLEAAVETCDGVVLRCYGSGTVPNTAELRRALEIAEVRQIPVVAVSQCPEGGLAFGTYASAAILREHGVIDGRDMTVEAAYAKLAYALAMHEGAEERRAWLGRSVCGEIGKRDA
ncbi:L-asparaginase 1 [Ruegeria marisrubri]|uniref:L-asparaginase 1 n=1 Tax=Ruegeria marisrubri TaxID=1685379 RepID=A0A117KHE8_9RHOB|nr:asparaginase [Ruegeria marisrubri]KUJ86186.1 L-asparaginase 1 [Ruegeria marisrubri]